MSRRVTRGSFPRSCTCGWSGTYATAAMADHSLKRHSCERWQAISRRKARGDARRASWAALDRIPKPCQHPRASHEHGTYAAYTLDGCRCVPCCDASSAYEKARVRRNAYGRSNLVDAQPTRDHVRSLMAQGMGLKRIARAGGVSHGSAAKLIYGLHDGPPSKRVRRDIAERLAAVTFSLADGSIAGPEGQVGVARRLQALIALGWSQAKLGARLDVTPANMGPLVHCRRQVTTRTHKTVVALYDELSMSLPPQETHRDKIAASRSRSYARRQGWLPPLALDDERLDDPMYLPHLTQEESAPVVVELDEAAIYRRSHGDRKVRLTRAEASELVQRWHAAGRPLSECERLTGIKPDRYLVLRDLERDEAAS